MEQDDLDWIIHWFYSQCDGDWEHGNSIRIETIDNSTWNLSICIEETELEGLSFEPVEIKRSPQDWVECTVKKQIFEGFGGPTNLPEILRLFRNWAELAEGQ
jgi:hypothetical protein